MGCMSYRSDDIPDAIELIEYRMRRISDTTDHRDLGEVKTEFDGVLSTLSAILLIVRLTNTADDHIA